MKNVIIYIILSMLMPAALLGDDRVQKTISDILPALARSGHVGIIGWEKLPGGHETFSIAPAIQMPANRFNPLELVKVIAHDTDYECIVGKDYFLIIPKRNSSTHDLPLSMREVSFPQSNNISFSRLLTDISAVDSTHPIYINDSAPYQGQLTEGSITVKVGRAHCYELINDMARQLKADYWVMGHMLPLDYSGDSHRQPMPLNVANISFFSYAFMNRLSH